MTVLVNDVIEGMTYSEESGERRIQNKEGQRAPHAVANALIDDKVDTGKQLFILCTWLSN